MKWSGETYNAMVVCQMQESMRTKVIGSRAIVVSLPMGAQEGTTAKIDGGLMIV